MRFKANLLQIHWNLNKLLQLYSNWFLRIKYQIKSEKRNQPLILLYENAVMLQMQQFKLTWIWNEKFHVLSIFVMFLLFSGQRSEQVQDMKKKSSKNSFMTGCINYLQVVIMPQKFGKNILITEQWCYGFLVYKRLVKKFWKHFHQHLKSSRHNWFYDYECTQKYMNLCILTTIYSTDWYFGTSRTNDLRFLNR